MQKRLRSKFTSWFILITVFILLCLVEFFLMFMLKFQIELIFENMIQCCLLNLTLIALYTWKEDNKISNIELVFEFDKRWDEIISEIYDKFHIIEKEIKYKKSDLNNLEYLNHLKLLNNNQEKLKFLLEKIDYYEGKNIKTKSYIDIYPAINIIRDSIYLITDTYITGPGDEILKAEMSLFELYKKNLSSIKEYVISINVYNDSEDIKGKIDFLVDEINCFTTNIKLVNNDKNKNMNSVLLGESVGNNRYFKDPNNKNLLFTSRNWNEENNRYGTWYKIPKYGAKSLDEGKDYYFIVRQENGNNEFPYLYISNDYLRSLVNEKDTDNSDSNSIHFYFNWNNDNSEVTDERDGIVLKSGTYELGVAQLRDKKLYKK